MVKCPNCGEINPNENKFCSKCGKSLNINPNTNKNQNTTTNLRDKILDMPKNRKIAGILVLCCIGVIIFGIIGGSFSDNGSVPSNNSNTNSNSKYNLDSFNKNECKNINYKELNKNPDKYDGENILVKGRVMQISEGNNGDNFLLLYVDGEYDQLVYVYYTNDTDIVEDNWITVYGICGGSYSYSTRVGNGNTVPLIYGVDLEKS